MIHTTTRSPVQRPLATESSKLRSSPRFRFLHLAFCFVSMSCLLCAWPRSFLINRKGESFFLLASFISVWRDSFILPLWPLHHAGTSYAYTENL
jgi:hypothetical protein